MFLAKAFQTDPRPMQEAKTLRNSGYPVFALAWDRESQFKTLDDVDGIVVRSFNHVKLGSGSALDLAFGAIVFQVFLILDGIRLIRALRQRPIIHCHDFNTLLPACFLRVLGLSVRLVYDCHELSYSAYSELFNSFVGSVVATIEEKCLKYADAVIIVSEGQNYLHRFNANTAIVRNCPMMSSMPKLMKKEARVQLGLPLNTFIVSHIGSIRYDSSLDLLLAVASLLKHENVQFVVVGGGPLAAEFRRQAKQDRDLRLTLIPEVRREKALLYVAASDITWVVYGNAALSPNTWAGMPWKFFESLACGVPVVVERETLRAQLVKKFGCGIVIDKDRPEYAAKAIIALAKDPAKCHLLSFAAKEAAVLEFNWEEMSRKLMDVYEQL
jgi:glycosyltransferase involved in cell wall biosynthesis